MLKSLAHVYSQLSTTEVAATDFHAELLQQIFKEVCVYVCLDFGLLSLVCGIFMYDSLPKLLV